MSRGPTWEQEASALLKIAAPLLFAFLSDVAVYVPAKIVVGRLGYRDLAAVGISTDISFQIVIVLMGLFSVVGVLVAEAIGAGRRQDALTVLVRSLVLATAAGVLTTALVFNMDGVLAVLGQDAEVVVRSRGFLDGLAWWVVPTLWFAVLRTFVAALMRTGLVMAISLAAVGVNYVLMQGLVHGDFGLPAFGLAGAGMAWGIIAWLKFACLAAYVAFLIPRLRLASHSAFALWNFRSFAPILKLGLPVGGIVALESGLFGAVSIMSGWLGVEALAAYQMLMGWIAIPFVISLGLAEAAMVRVAYWAGAEHAAAARQAGLFGMALGVAIPAVLILVPLGFPQLVIAAFLDAGDPGFTAISALVTQLLFVAALFQVFDGLQAVASHALRGLRDAVLPLIIAGLGYWVVGLGCAYAMAFGLHLQSLGLWWGLALGLAFTGTLLALRFEILSRRSLA